MTPSAQLSPRVAALLKKNQAARGRLVFALDATASREATWDLAMTLQALMFEEAARIGNLDVQLARFGGDEFRASPWFSDALAVMSEMRTIRCVTGATQIAQVLRHIGKEHAREKIAAAVFIGDACEEVPSELYAAAAGLPPLFVFQEGDLDVMYLNQRGEIVNTSQRVSEVFREIARTTGGAYAKFDAGAARQLGEMLRAVAAFATGGIAALAHQQTHSARLLLGQMN
jgi:hypothetical protein